MNSLTRWFVIAGVGGLSLTALPVFSGDTALSNNVEQSSGSIVSLRQAWMKAETDGQEAEARRFCEQYVQRLENQANQGDVPSMVELGKLMSRGSSVYPRNLETARSWFEKAARSGDADSQYHLGFMYHAGLGGGKDEALANKWFSEARKNMESHAGGGDADSAFWVGVMYLKGEGTAVDNSMAFQWMEKAGNSGSALAPPLLARMYREGIGTQADEEQAYKWFLKAAGQGNVDAMMETALALRNGTGVGRNPVQARHWLGKAAELKNPYALRELASMMKTGEGGGKDLPQARAYYIQAASYGEPHSAVEAARMLLDGDNVSAEEEKQARDILFASADRFRSPIGQYELGNFDWNHGDKDSGVYWIRTAAMSGYAPAMERMGNLSLTPFSGLNWNPVAAWQWWDLAAGAGGEESGTRANWLLWGGGGIVLLLVAAFLVWMNRWINRKWAAEKE